MKNKPTIFLTVLIALCLISCNNNTQTPITVFSIGDSTMSTKRAEQYPVTGWGQVLSEYFNKNVLLRNYAKGGRSTKSFINEGLWTKAFGCLSAGDYVFIQFGHNDEKEYKPTVYAAPFGLFKQNLEKFVVETRAKEATPILFTSIARRSFDEEGKLVETHGDYNKVVKMVAEEQDVILVDMNKLTTDYINDLGVEASKEIFNWIGATGNFPEGAQDNTHLSEKGAKEFARLAMEDLGKNDIELSKYLNLKRK